MRHRDFEASIQCEKKTLEEYSVDVEGPGKITSWVPSEVGKVSRVAYTLYRIVLKDLFYSWTKDVYDTHS